MVTKVEYNKGWVKVSYTSFIGIIYNILSFLKELDIVMELVGAVIGVLHRSASELSVLE